MNRPTMVRQTNEHELLPTHLRDRWFTARTPQERRTLLEDIERYKTTLPPLRMLTADEILDLWKPPSPGLPAPLIL